MRTRRAWRGRSQPVSNPACNRHAELRRKAAIPDRELQKGSRLPFTFCVDAEPPHTRDFSRELGGFS